MAQTEFQTKFAYSSKALPCQTEGKIRLLHCVVRWQRLEHRKTCLSHLQCVVKSACLSVQGHLSAGLEACLEMKDLVSLVLVSLTPSLFLSERQACSSKDPLSHCTEV